MKNKKGEENIFISDNTHDFSNHEKNKKDKKENNKKNRKDLHDDLKNEVKTNCKYFTNLTDFINRAGKV